MVYNEARNRASQKYNKEHLEQMSIRVAKGNRAKYTDYCKKKEISLTKLIVKLLDEEMERNP